jgi:hypothetical protein
MMCKRLPIVNLKVERFLLYVKLLNYICVKLQ